MSERAKMRRCISAYDFAILDLETYLDSHPDDALRHASAEQYMCKRRGTDRRSTELRCRPLCGNPARRTQRQPLDLGRQPLALGI